MSENIKIIFPDGREASYPRGVTGFEIAEKISPALAKVSLAIDLNGRVCDIHLPINEDASIKIIKRENDEALELIRHDCAHIMAEAVQELFPGTQVTIGPAIENGFYYDFVTENSFTTDDLIKIEEKMKEIVEDNTPFVREVWNREDAIAYFNNEGETYKAEIVSDLPEDESITVYKQGKWLDLCRGPHLPATGQIGKSFKLMNVAGAYWKGDSKNEMLSRIYGTAWRNDKELRSYLKMLEEANPIRPGSDQRVTKIMCIQFLHPDPLDTLEHIADIHGGPGAFKFLDAAELEGRQ